MLTDQENPDPRRNEFSKDENSATEADNDQSTANSVCSSAKQHRKMQVEGLKEKEGTVSFSYSWTQTETDITVTIKIQGLSDEQTRAFDVSFTSKEVNIKAGDRSQMIYLYDNIQKEESRVQATKGSIILHVVKQNQRQWPQLESDTKRSLTEMEQENPESGDKTEQEKGNLREDPSMESSPVDPKPDLAEDIKEKEEEPVYLLNLLKHDFYERDLQLTLSVFTKSLNKDAVKVNFSKKGFVLKFQTSDAKFLQLHQGTSSETAFTWPVTTRQEIIPEDCKFTVKTSVIEIVLRKTSSVRWVTLEASQRKEKSESSHTDTWIPINAKSSTAPSPSSSEISSARKSLSEESNKQVASGGPSSGVVFDDLSEINVNLRGAGQRVGASSNMHRYQQEEDEDGPGSFSFDNSQKPTAKVSPLNNQASETGLMVPPGFAGLVNIGNTCFMNCIIQVLANTREFRDFFLDGRFQNDINEDNPLGMKGQLAVTFGALLRWLWSCKKHYWDPRRLKDLVSKKNPQFFGYAQHDAHEFLAFLLDGLHEDLNRIKKKPYTETIDSDGRPDKVVADEAWAQYKLRNDSVVVDLFQGQLKSKLVCPKCGKVSITFDPFLYMSVPLPKKKKVIPVHFFWKESYKKPIKYLIQVSQDSSVERLREELSARTHVRACDIRVFEAYRGRILKFFCTGATLSSVEPKDVIVACELLSEEVAGEDVIEIPVMQRTLFPSEYPSHCAFCRKTCMEGSPLKRCTKCYKVGYCDQTCQRNHWNSHKSNCSTLPDPIGCPFIMSVPASRATFSYLVKHMEEFARFSVNIFQPPVKSSSASASSTAPDSLHGLGAPPSNAKTYSASPAVGSVGSSSLSSSSSVLPGASTSAGVSLGPSTNLSSCSLSQSSSSLNSLDSLSSASSTCTLTGDTSDTATGGGGRGPELGEGAEEASAALDTSIPPRYASPCPPQLIPQAYDGLASMSGADVNRSGSVDSGFESIGAKTGEKAVPVTSVLGVQATEVERDRATPTFFIKPVSMEGTGLKGAERLEDKGDTPLELTSGRFLSMDWKNNERMPNVLVQSKELESVEVDNLNNFAHSAGSKSTLYDCLEMFTEPEVLSPEEAWYCPSCKKHVEASKQMSIWRLPHTLVIQLKRFSFQNFLMRSKIKKHIDFPIRGLDLSKFCVGLQPGDSPPVYDLYGVANHHGLLIGGHYTSYVRCSGLGCDVGAGDEIGWRLCNDSRVTPAGNEKSVVTADAYLLFYRRRCPIVIGPSAGISLGQAASSEPLTDGNEGQAKATVHRPEDRYSQSMDRGDNGEDFDGDDDETKDDKVSEIQFTNPKMSSETSNAQARDSLATSAQRYSGGGNSDESSGTAFDIDLKQKGKSVSLQADPQNASCDISFSPLTQPQQQQQQQQTDTDNHCENYLQETGEKKDREKEFFDCDRLGHPEVELDDDDDDRERGLVIASVPELDYTDMEAVD
ncbi:hypothetical protein EGW08_016563 [Elysia chlorotica]|uniref:ubiquitinyl hydrolase 1 n=1 Tax=Elysia chlorotica TaxID=188477 RepID=A0A3S1B491_ELYCH|nr:hypothetical protein EGW08_016563 [Elysia chlorotica]